MRINYRLEKVNYDVIDRTHSPEEQVHYSFTCVCEIHSDGPCIITTKAVFKPDTLLALTVIHTANIILDSNETVSEEQIKEVLGPVISNACANTTLVLSSLSSISYNVPFINPVLNCEPEFVFK